LRLGPALACAALLAYVGFEAYAINKVSHRTKPDYIYPMLARAGVATELCQSDALALSERFEKTLGRVAASYRNEIISATQSITPQQANEELAQVLTDAQLAITETFNTHGCDSAQMKAHFQRYRIYARKTR